MSRCSRGRCARRAWSGGLCRPHFDADRENGRGLVDSTAARDHIAKLRSLGWTDDAISKQVGTIRSGIWHLRHGRVRIAGSLSKAILSVPLTPFASKLGVDATGTLRRIRALGRMGHSRDFIAEGIGRHKDSLRTVVYRKHVSAALAQAVKEFYEEWADKPGTCKESIGHARGRGTAPPAAWEGIDMDDPNAVPDLGGDDAEVDEILVERVVAGTANGNTGNKVAVPLQDRVEAVRRMLRLGVAPSTMAIRIGTSKAVVDRLIEQLQPKPEEAAA